MVRRLTQEEFRSRLSALSKGRYSWDNAVYNGHRHDVELMCPVHGIFHSRPAELFVGNGCKRCANLIRFPEFVLRSNKIHDSKYTYIENSYTDISSKISIICPYHGRFDQYAQDHTTGSGCPSCSGVNQKTTEEFVLQARMIHGNKYDYSKTVYVNARAKLKIICPVHGSFIQSARNHTTQKQGCPECSHERGKRVYLIEFGFPNRSFLKIGIMKDTVSRRFPGYKSRCSIRVHKIIECETAEQACELEFRLLLMTLTHSTLGTELADKWKGHTECRVIESLPEILSLMETARS